MPADIEALQSNLRAWVEIKVGATSTNRNLAMQIALIESAFTARVDETLSGGARATSTSFAGESFGFDYPGANNDDIATALRELRASLINELAGTIDAREQTCIMPRFFLRR